MSKPNETSVETIDGINVQIEVWTDPTNEPWDGDEPLEAGAEGWDVMVKATIGFNGGQVTGGSSLCSIWIMPNDEGVKYLREQIDHVTDDAISSAFDELTHVASGRDVDLAIKRQRGAMQLVANRGLLKLERARALYIKEATRPARDALTLTEENRRKANDGAKAGANRPGTRARAVNRMTDAKLELARQQTQFGEIFQSVVDGKLEP